MTPLQQCAVGARAAYPSVCPEVRYALVWERGQLARSKAYTKFARLHKAKWQERYAPAVPCGHRCSLSGSS